eukprot:CAMPEP_0116578458 /NCGR_PEP_ID=MMETSP0397-20121206/21717_1 /TAXON_ID=216820 /ORGANISM="Cyclophora tenuis, Strain ECT3854" /LENGTH=206 /DNA_ID=CAMNT_0004107849 /DNA_START=3 /DNA_END=623 /DNA_ORIENTATION=+
MTEAAQLASKMKGKKFYLVDCFGWNGACVLDLGTEPHQFRIEASKTKKLSELQTVETQVPLGSIWKVPLDQKVGKARVDKKHPPLVWLQYRCLLEYHHQTNEWPSSDKADHFVEVIQKYVAQYESLAKLPFFQEPDTLRQWAITATAQMPPVCAVLGGVLGNEVIKAISGKGEPANNTLILDGFDGKCRNLFIAPPKEETSGKTEQ